MALGNDIIVDLSDIDDDDCVLEAVIYNSNGIHNNNMNYDNIFKENPLLAEVIEKCLNLEHSEGMLRVVNKTLLKVYNEADPSFKASSDLVTLLKRTLIRLDKDPDHKFSHIKDLCDSLQSSKFKKRAQLITLEKKIRPKHKRKLTLKRKSHLERLSKRQKTDIIDLDKYEEVPIVNLDTNDTVIVNDYDSPIVIDDEKENHSSQENGDGFMETSTDEDMLHDKGQNENYTSKETSESTNKKPAVINLTEDSPKKIYNEFTQQSNIANNNSSCSANAEKILDNIIDQIKLHTPESPEKLLVPLEISTVDLHTEDEPQRIDISEKIKSIELEIDRCKKFIAKLDKLEVTDDSANSPYIRSEKCKQKIVLLYKELCALTGAEVTKRRAVTLTVIEGHPPGPVKRLESFLNKNIGEDGNPPFPDFGDVVKCVTTANLKDCLGWSQHQIMKEASALFTHCGRALQKRRQKREWSDLLARVKAEDCEEDPADNDPELLARLQANRLLALEKEANVFERYSMMQNLPPQSKTTNVVLPPQDVAMKSASDDSSDDFELPKVNLNTKIASTKEKNTNELDSNIMDNVNSNSHSKESINSVFQTNTSCTNLVQNATYGMPQIINAQSITNQFLTDEFGLKIIPTPEISNVDVNFEFNNKDGNFQSNVSSAASASFDSNVEGGDLNSNSQEVNSPLNELNEVQIKIEPTENITNLLNEFGDNYTVSIFDIEDPFLVVEISDSSDED